SFLRWLGEARAEKPTPAPAAHPVPLPPRRSGQRADAPKRLLVVSNRLPELRSPVTPDETRKKNVGGLVSALEPVLATRGGLWLGWNGRASAESAPLTTGLNGDSTPALAWLE